MNESLKASVQDSLQYLLELNREIELFNSQSISQEELLNFIKRRSKDWNYIADFKYTHKLIKQINETSIHTKR